MYRSFTQNLCQVKQAFAFAHHLFQRTDPRFMRIQRFKQFVLIGHMTVVPIVLAGLAQWFVNMFAEEKVIPFRYMIWTAVAILVFSMFMIFLSHTLRSYMEVFEERIEYNMHRQTARKMARLRFPVLLDPESVDAIENSTFTFSDLESLATMRVRLIACIAAIVIGTGLSIFLNPLILVVCFVITFANHRIRSYFWKKIEDCRDSMVEEQRRAKNYRAHNRDIQNYIQFSVWGFVSYMNRNLMLIGRKVMRVHRELYRAERRAHLLWTPIVLAVALTIVIWGLSDAFQHSQGILVLGIWFSAFRTVSRSFNELFAFWRGARSDAREFERYQRFLNLPERSTDLPRLPESASYQIDLSDVTYTYPGRSEPAVNGLSLSIAQGERVALIGRNGSGKTTTLALLCGFLDSSGGSVQVNGVDLQTVDTTSWHSVLGCVTQMSDIGMTIGELVSGNKLTEATELVVWRALACVGLSEEILKLKHKLDSRVGEAWSDGTDFSTGQRQKLRLAVVVYKVLMQKAKVIILDEPTANLDVESKVSVISMFAELGITLIVSVHDQSLLPHFTRIVELDKGKLLSDRPVY